MNRLNWTGVLIGAVLAVTITTAVGSFFPATTGDLAEPATLISIVVSFLAYLAGGYLAGLMTGHSGGINGLMVAVMGFFLNIIVGAVLAVVVTATGGSLPQPNPGSVDVTGAAIAAGASLGLTFLGGYVGGVFGERFSSRAGGR
ncbi:hypothetical protein BH24ACT22_BH24ACT22_19840 [soil metagenome]